jgi:ADP-ribosylglycohydrolase
MLGAIAGDIIGSVFEGSGLKVKEFPLLSLRNVYTDDAVLTVAVAAAILGQGDGDVHAQICLRRVFQGCGSAKWSVR